MSPYTTPSTASSSAGRRPVAGADAGLLDPPGPLEHLGLGDAEPLPERGVRPSHDGEVPLQRVQQLAIDVVELVGLSGDGRI
jgi:hypothetical protein